MKLARFQLMITSLFFLLLISSNAHSYKKIKCFILEPPGQILEGVKRVAILDFTTQGTSEEAQADLPTSGKKLALHILSEVLKEKTKDKNSQIMDHGKNFTSYLTTELIQDKRGIGRVATGFLGMGSGREGKSFQDGTFTNIFEIVERNQLEKVIQEQEMAAAGLVDENFATQLGNMLGAQALIMGDVSYFSKDSKYQEERTKKQDGKNVKYKVNCESREVKVRVKTQIVSSETGQIWGSKTEEETLKKSKCEGDWGSGLPNLDEMIDECLKKSVTKIANYLTPHYKMETYELDKIDVKQFKNPGEKAADLAENLKIDEAFVIYKTIFDKDAYNPEVLYNIGILHEVVGNFSKADEFYKMAQQLKDEGKYKKALERVEKNVAFAAALAKIGIEIKEHSFEVSETAQAKALAKKVKIKGKREDRVDVFSQPTNTSDVVTRVPGELQFTVLQKEGDWYLIELLGGQQGYVHKDKVEEK
ncbi:SH3 domain-containing protein [candidate division KSB1 bacterium]|nr:SH3 domain-containing protein [candidate division KSB1 bacterium]